MGVRMSWVRSVTVEETSSGRSVWVEMFSGRSVGDVPSRTLLLYSFRLTHKGKILLFLIISLNIIWVDATTLSARLTGRGDQRQLADRTVDVRFTCMA